MAGGEDGSSAAAMPLLAAVVVVEEGKTKQRRRREGCPGCRLEEENKANAGIPYLNFFYIWVVCLTACTLLVG
nr:unnamed protein product [Digitaria exilis]